MEVHRTSRRATVRLMSMNNTHSSLCVNLLLTVAMRTCIHHLLPWPQPRPEKGFLLIYTSSPACFSVRLSNSCVLTNRAKVTGLYNLSVRKLSFGLLPWEVKTPKIGKYTNTEKNIRRLAGSQTTWSHKEIQIKYLVDYNYPYDVITLEFNYMCEYISFLLHN